MDFINPIRLIKGFLKVRKIGKVIPGQPKRIFLLSTFGQSWTEIDREWTHGGFQEITYLIFLKREESDKEEQLGVYTVTKCLGFGPVKRTFLWQSPWEKDMHIEKDTQPFLEDFKRILREYEEIGS